MIVRPRPTPFSLLFILRGSILPTIAPRVAVVVVFSAVVAAVHGLHPQHFPELTVVPFTLLGLALSIFLGFRNNACYERWWEGRRQWGALIAETRALLREAITLLPDDRALHARLAERTAEFARALRGALRGEPAVAGRVGPNAILWQQSHDLAAQLRAGALGEVLYRALANRLDAMTAIQAACERLRSTPTPFTYTLLLHRTAWLFCLLLPLGLAGSLGLATPLASAMLAYAFFGLDALGDELEEPFGRNQNALPLDALVRTIEIAAREAVGEPAPAPLQAVDYVLS